MGFNNKTRQKISQTRKKKDKNDAKFTYNFGED